jgi:hypothetical protein
MRSLRLVVVTLVLAAAVAVAQAQTPPTDIYHVMFVKALPGQAAALAKQLQEQDSKDPMAGHYLLLRHQEGDDWDYCLIQHVGKQATVTITAPPPPGATPTQAWHIDTFAAGPSWGELSKLMTGPAGSVYVVSTHRAAPGHRPQLLAALGQRDSGAKVPLSSAILTHLEGGNWIFLTLDRYNSWQDLAADRASAASAEKGWFEIRQHSASHLDTIADRVMST